ncbi:FAD-binding oxidoreductase [Pseudomonas typographi]|uniref:FAD-binding oxidoreductase n=1 Tax=Pseudomonas typographi TaxID=2715964 RepID=UPI001681E553|nr:FAD-binding oxidoreductase [Pseudomonas typographi]MBD1551240.1 FAD-binding oxidoreductase [Pseudomonas typographi]MBD1586266.1 FAD-binding oxidoreductase [Pseudomonas typographi]
MTDPLLHALVALLGERYAEPGAAAGARLSDKHQRYHGKARAFVRPASTEQVAAVVRLCAEHAACVVVQGGNTGLMAAATPDDSGRAVLVSLERMNAIREVDTANDTLTAEAGCILRQVQLAAEGAGRLFPLSLGAEGSCTLGGNLGTNAGGTAVLRYGNARELTLGLEVVTAEGEIWHGLRGLRKDNTGYDLRDLYIGSEGTLGIITAATLKLYPLPASRATAYVAFASLADGVALLAHARAGFSAALTGFELMAADCLALVAEQFPGSVLPFDRLTQPWYALLEVSYHGDHADAVALMERVLEGALEQGLITDASLAQSVAQSQAMWQLREHMSEAQAREGRNMKHDISLPLSRIEAFVASTAVQLQAQFPGVRHYTFGHLGDGNLHYNIASPRGMSVAEHMARYHALSRVVHDNVHAHGGSISAEHGIGQRKRDELPRYKSTVELGLMRRIKRALDPHNRLNPGKVIALENDTL